MKKLFAALLMLFSSVAAAVAPAPECNAPAGSVGLNRGKWEEVKIKSGQTVTYVVNFDAVDAGSKDSRGRVAKAPAGKLIAHRGPGQPDGGRYILAWGDKVRGGSIESTELTAIAFKKCDLVYLTLYNSVKAGSVPVTAQRLVAY